MSDCPFLEDPRLLAKQQVARAVSSQHEGARAMHLRLAEHHAAVARASALPFVGKDERS